MFVMDRVSTPAGLVLAMANLTMFTACSLENSQPDEARTMIITTERHFEFTAEQVYAAWVGEDTLVAPVTRIEKDVRLGGHYRLFVQTDDFTAVMQATYLEIQPNRKLVYSWEWNDDGEETRVEVNFIPQGNGCLVKLAHGEFQKQESFDRHAFGWENYFDGLVKQLKGE